MKIIEVIDPAEKQKVARKVLEALPDWFGIPQAREDYINNCSDPFAVVFLQHAHHVYFSCIFPSVFGNLKSSRISGMKTIHARFMLCR